jgi:hypothetical protein
VNRHSVRIWGTEHQRDSPKVNVLCAASHEKVHSPFFFTEVTGNSFLDMLENWLLPQLNTSYGNYILQLDRAPLHFDTNVQVLLSRVLPQRWIGRAANGDNNPLPWPPCSPDLTPWNFFLWEFDGLINTAFMCYYCPRASRSFVIGKLVQCRPLITV